MIPSDPASWSVHDTAPVSSRGGFHSPGELVIPGLNVAGSTPVTRFHLKPLRIPHLGDTPDRIREAHGLVHRNNGRNSGPVEHDHVQ